MKSKFRSGAAVFACGAMASTVAVFAQQDLTTNTATGSATAVTQARYLVNLAFATGDSVRAPAAPSGIYDYSSNRGNGSPWYVLNDGLTTAVAVTYADIGRRGSASAPPDFFGYKFKAAADITQVVYSDYCFSDGGTFNGAPTLQYLTAANGTWTDVSANWNTPFVSSFASGRKNTYTITPSATLTNAWGIRLRGETSPSSAWDTNGWASVTELQVSGTPHFGTSVQFNSNLALTASPICSNSAWVGTSSSGLCDGDFSVSATVKDTTSPTGNKFVGLSWSTPQTSVGALGVTLGFLSNGGWFQDTTSDPLRVQFTQDGSNWQEVTSLDKGLYTADYMAAQALGLTSTYNSSWLFTFDPVSGITGLRLFGLPGGAAADMGGNGYLNIGELQAFAVTPIPEPGGIALLLCGLAVLLVFRDLARRGSSRQARIRPASITT